MATGELGDLAGTGEQGDRGAGSSAGGGADNRGVKPGASRASERGQTGANGEGGQDGKVRCVDCAQGTCSSAPKSQKKKPNYCRFIQTRRLSDFRLILSFVFS